MTQLSRPYQIALVAMALFVAVWFLALRGRTATPEASSSSSSPAVATPQTAQSTVKAAVTTAPAKRAAAPVSPERAKTTTKARHATAARPAHTAEGTKSHSAAKAAPAVKAVPAPKHAPAKTLSPEASVEAQLKQGKLVAILFWNPASPVDATVGQELAAAAGSLGGKLAVHRTGADQVGTFGSITRAVQIDQTPTILLIDKTGRTVVLTGLTDAYAIKQAIEELRG
jgi:hypothetical protein